MNRKRHLLLSPLLIVLLSLCLSDTFASPVDKLQAAEVDACFSALADFDYGKELAPLRKLAAYIESLGADSDESRQLEARLVSVLTSSASVAAKDFACRQLGLIGKEAALPPLEKLLGDTAARESALNALERIPGSDPVLRRALASSTGPGKIPVIAALGRRRDAESVLLLEPLVRDNDAAISRSAIRALGMIGTPAAAAILLEARRASSGNLADLAGLSLLDCAEQLASTGETQEATRVFRELNRPGNNAQLQLGALRGLSLLVKDPAVLPDLVAFIKREDPRTAANAVQVLLQMPGPEPVRALADALPGLEPVLAEAAILALADRQNAKEALPRLVDASRSSSPEVRAAALKALGRLGDSSHVSLLVEALAASIPAERTAAQQALSGMNCPNFDLFFLDLLKKAGPDTRLELVGIIEERRMTDAADSLLESVKKSDGKLRTATLKALRRTASESHIRPLVDFLASSSDPTDTTIVGETVASLLRQSPQPHVGYVIQSYRASSFVPRRSRLIAGLRGVGDPGALSLLKEAMTAGDREIQRAAILSLSDWPDPAPIPGLLGVAGQKSLDATLRTLALRGSLRLVALRGDRNHANSVAVLRQVFALAPEVAEKKSALAMLERFPSPEAVAMGEAALSDPAVSAEAKSALEHLRAAVAGDAQVLVYTRNYASSGEIYIHDNIASSVAAIQRLGRENGFSVDVTDQPSVFRDENLARYKAIIFSNSNGEAFENDGQREAFRRYIRRGGGFVGIHSVCASEPEWPWFWSLVGGTFDFHPPLQPFTIRVKDKNHPSTAFFDRDTWTWEDEFYFLKERNDKVRVLLAGEVKSLKKPGDHPERLIGQPDPCPLVWCHEFEGGRAWYTALGHKKEHYEDPVYLKHLLGGLFWVLGSGF